MVASVSDPVSAFRQIQPSASRLVESAELSDIYAYGIEPLPGGDLLMTAERNARPVVARISPEGHLRALCEVATSYRGISASATSNGHAHVLTYDTTAGRPEVLLETFDVSAPLQIHHILSVPFELAPTVLRIYDIGAATWQEGEAIAVIALVGDDNAQGLREEALLFHRDPNGIRFAHVLPRISSLNELRSITLFASDDGCLYTVACRRFWLANEAFLFRVCPDEELLDRRSFECQVGDFQQAGVTVDRDGQIVLACIHRHRRDIDGIRYNIETFEAS